MRRPTADAQASPERPFAQGKSFTSLDQYLAHLERRGATGVPWYKEVSPGVYELISRRGPRAKRVTYTRAELMARFGFSE